MNCKRWEVAFTKKLVQFSGPLSALDEDDDLVEFEAVKKIVQLAVLLGFGKLDVILQKSVKGKSSIIGISIDFERVTHEFLANWADLLGKSGAEHHDLLLGWCGSEDLLDISSHVCIRC